MARTPEQAGRLLKRAIRNVIKRTAPIRRYAQKTLGERATGEYMQRADIGPRGGTSGPLRIQTGRLARSVTGSRGIQGAGSESIMKVTGQNRGLRIEWGSRVPYARVHEKGFSGQVPVQAHARTITQAFGQSIPATQVQVQAHSKQMQIPARPYLMPSLRDEAVDIGEFIAEQYVDAIRDAIKS